MNKRVWVKTGYDRYDNTDKWVLGTVVGETSLPYMQSDNLQDMLDGPKLSKRYLIQLDNGGIEEAWYWDTYEPVADEADDD